jgi:16S rRNA (uracil1498-N3)-methyltransferase
MARGRAWVTGFGGASPSRVGGDEGIMHRFHARPEEARGETLVLSPRESRHAVRVLRLRVGDRLAVLTGAGEECLGEVQEVRRAAVTVRVLGRERRERLPYRITLAQAVPKGRSMEFIIQKATELGVDRVIPVLTERTVPGFGSDTAVAKRERWVGTAIEAMKQCGLAWLPRIDAPVSLPVVLEREEQSELVLAGSLQPGAGHPRRYFDAFVGERGRMPASVTVWIGPEGDFTNVELEQILGSGAKPVTMGRQVLRSETAAMYMLSVVQYELGAELNVSGRVES